MRDYTSIGPSPCDEECVQVGTPDYMALARPECQRFLELIRKELGPEPPGAQLRIKSNAHDFGSYLDVVCYFDDQDEEATDYAYRCEADAPQTWS